jgi:ABC-2 type transport system ATP-binding protein
MSSTVTTTKLAKTYEGNVQALQGIDLTVPRGQLFTLLGQNGAGKTTFLRILSTQLEATSGDGQVLDYSVTRQPNEVRKHIAVVPQEATAYSMRTPWEYAYTFARLRGASKQDAKSLAEQAMKDTDLWEQRNQICLSLSGGQKRRAIIASALASHAEVLMLDEPTIGLDAVARRTVWSALRRMVREGRTILLTTHNMEEAEIISDTLAIIDKGQVVAQGRPEEVRALVNQKYRVVVEGDFDCSTYEDRVEMGDRQIIYLHNQGDALTLVGDVLKTGARAAAAPVTLEDVFVKLVGGVEA